MLRYGAPSVGGCWCFGLRFFVKVGSEERPWGRRRGFSLHSRIMDLKLGASIISNLIESESESSTEEIHAALNVLIKRIENEPFNSEVSRLGQYLAMQLRGRAQIMRGGRPTIGDA